MRRAAEENPLTLELRPIIQRRFGKLWIVANLASRSPFAAWYAQGHDLRALGRDHLRFVARVSPRSRIMATWARSKFPERSSPTAFVVPALNFHFIPQLELNLGIGFGVDRASNGAFLESIVGWGFLSGFQFYSPISTALQT